MELVRANYFEIVDPDTITRTGERLTTALSTGQHDRSAEALLDRHSELLLIALEMIVGPGSSPHSPVTDLFPAGHREPAWVALIRSGRIYITTNGNSEVHVFLRGDDPQKAYDENYPVLRHCLADLCEIAGKPIVVDVFTYEHDYRHTELQLHLKPHQFATASFGAPDGQRSIGLERLARFFDTGIEISGGEISQAEGLELRGAKTLNQTLAGAPVDLSDLAVAYRAVFHSRHNPAFVSLDPAVDPTKTTVNFGGLLENTRLGEVLLKADKRFKTITSGCDPQSLTDVRSTTRAHVSDFLTTQELDLLRRGTLPTPEATQATRADRWVSTRLWFYPEKIKVDTNPDYSIAEIKNPRFTADAERSRDDFATSKEYQEQKSALLWPSIRDSIDDLNRRYDDYAKVFSELSELDTVGRLMAICEWLFRYKPTWLDCDELLSVPVPDCATAVETTKMIVATVLSYPAAEPLRETRVAEESVVVYLSELLERTVEEFFQTPDGIEKYLRYLGRLTSGGNSTLDGTASSLFDEYRDQKVRALLRTQDSLKAFASYAADTLTPPMSLAGNVLTVAISEMKDSLNLLDKDITKLDHEMIHLRERLRESRSHMDKLVIRRDDEGIIVAADGLKTYEDLRETHNDIVEKLNRVVQKYNETVNERKSIGVRHNKDVEELNALRIVSTRTLEIGGGVSANSANISFRLDSSLEEFFADKLSYQDAGLLSLEAPEGTLVKTERASTAVPTAKDAAYLKALWDSVMRRSRCPGVFTIVSGWFPRFPAAGMR